jgi:tetratricopeptide (TPR) repeat protein
VAGLFVAGLLVLAGVAAYLGIRSAGPPGHAPSASAPAVGNPPAPVERADREVFGAYAGSDSCRDCHREAYDEWARSHHGLAERPVRADLDDDALSRAPSAGLTSGPAGRAPGSATPLPHRIAARGLSGEVQALPVVGVIGHAPLRQYLVPSKGGRWQALQTAFDPARRDWFDVFGTENRQPGEWGHWTGRGMNWNSMCAGCHNTRLRKHYSAAGDRYDTTMAERGVGCEACHGPLRRHVQWQRQPHGASDPDPTLPPTDRARMLDTCGACHARRVELTGEFAPGDRFLDHFALVGVGQTDHYYTDGQVRDENFELAAFLGSRMHGRGVTCGDCHLPHSAKPRLPGNWLCLRCHNGAYPNAPVIDPVGHSHHRVHGFGPDGQPTDTDLMDYGSDADRTSGGECANCHMPQTTYMQRHPRRDHGFTIPDPLLTLELGIPNACTRCHADKPVDWAEAAARTWYGSRLERPTRERARTIARARAGERLGRDQLLACVATNAAPYWTANAAELLSAWAHEPAVVRTLARLLDHPDALVRAAAARALEAAPFAPHSPALPSLRRALADPVRGVRLAAAWTLRAELEQASTAGHELRRSLDVNADQPSGQLQWAAYHEARDALHDALKHLQTAIGWDSNSPPFHHEMAVVLSRLGRPAEALARLQIAVGLAPRNAEYRFKLGLAFNELGDSVQARAALEDSVRLDPLHARAWYNLGLAQNAAGEADRAIQALERAESLDPDAPAIPYARGTIHYAQRQPAKARAAARRVLELDPAHHQAREIIEAVENQVR